MAVRAGWMEPVLLGSGEIPSEQMFISSDVHVNTNTRADTQTGGQMPQCGACYRVDMVLHYMTGARLVAFFKAFSIGIHTF